MKVFISHKQEDSQIAFDLAKRLAYNGVNFYLDVLDANIAGDGKKLTDHIKAELNDCTDILVVMSENTRYSQWVPFEIGMSAQKNMPTVTFLKADVSLPSFLTYWPRLKRITDIDTYVKTRKRVKERYDNEYRGKSMFDSTRRTEELKAFYTELRIALL